MFPENFFERENYTKHCDGIPYSFLLKFWQIGLKFIFLYFKSILCEIVF